MTQIQPAVPANSPETAHSTPMTSGSVLEEMLAKIDRVDIIRTVVVAILAILTVLGVTLEVAGVPIVPTVGLIIGLWPIVKEAFGSLLERRMTMELSMLIAIVAAALIGEWATALIITTFVLAAEILEDMAVGRGRDALTDLMTFLPNEATVLEEGTARTIPLADVEVGMTVRVQPGGRVPVDGTVLSGDTSLDESRITGESLPVDKTVGDEVFSGSTNRIGAIDIRADRVGEESSYGRIVAAVKQSQESEPPVMELADKLASSLVYLSLGGALLTWIFTRDITNTISVIIAAGACGVAAGTPLAIVAAIARIARGGAFIKDGAYLEKLSVVDTIAFDKTGTLTLGEPSVIRVDASGGDTDELIRLAASAEVHSEHPLAEAIVDEARKRELELVEVQDFAYEPGRGITATVNGRRLAAGNRALVADAPTPADAPPASEVHVSLDGTWAGTIWLADTVRDTSRAAIDDLHDMGLRTMMVTGDREAPAVAVAEELGMDDVRAGLLPEEKVVAVKEAMDSGATLAVVGDGVNDAAALTQADVGFAMGSGTHIARESADVVLISSDINDVAHTVHVARRARRIIMFNFIGTIVVDVIAMLLAAFGIIGPMVAGLIHVGSESFFILNSARLLPGPLREADAANA